MMKIHDLEWKLGQLADVTVFDETSREALRLARDMVAEIRALTHQSRDFSVADLRRRLMPPRPDDPMADHAERLAFAEEMRSLGDQHPDASPEAQ